jgi:Flp pilus assembly protein TadG
MNRRALHRFLRDREGNLSTMLALVLVPAIGLMGMGIDFTLSSKRKSMLDALADSASLAAVTPAMLAQPDSASINAATSLFNAQSSLISGIGAVTLSVTATDALLTRTVTVSYQTTTTTLFGNLVGKSTVPLTGMSQSISSVAPNIDFYLLLDNSPSMAIAATTAGINTMVAATPDKCAFACHESDLAPFDYYGLARTLGVPLRMDLLRQATQNLMTAAQTAQTNNNAKYRAAIYTFNIGFNTIASLTSSLSTAKTQAANIDIYEVPAQNWSSDAITAYTKAMNQINSVLPAPGTGTNATGDTPQEVLFIVTDGVQDEMVNGSRVQALMDPSYCTTIKNRGIRIAVLYTEYLRLPTNPWYMDHIDGFQPNIGTNLKSCASPQLYFKVTTDDDISAAMLNLFNAAVKSAYLSK